MTSFDEGGDLVAALLRSAAGLESGDERSLEISDDLLRVLEQERLLHQAVAISHRPESRFIPIQGSEWLGRVRGGLAHQLRVEAAGVRSVEILRRADVDVLVMKGLASAHLDHDVPALRESADVDLFVDRGSVERAIGAFGGDGVELAHRVQRGWWDIQHAVTFSVDGVEVDLHHRPLHQGPGFLARDLPLFERSVSFEMAGVTVLAPSGPHRLIIAACQNTLAAERDRRLSNDVDVLRLIHHEEAAMAEADSVGLGWVVDAGLRRARALAQLPVPTRHRRLSGRDRLLRWSYGPERSVVRTAVCEVVLADPRAAARIAWCDVFPSDDYLSGRRRTRWQQVRRQLSRVGVGRSVDSD